MGIGIKFVLIFSLTLSALTLASPFYQQQLPFHLPWNQWDQGQKLNATTLQALLDDHVTFSGEAGTSAAILTADGQKWQGSSGVSDRELHSPMNSSSAFRVGSNTKVILAILIFQLFDEGKLDLDSPLGNFVDGYPAWKNITLKQLLHMRSGIPDFLVNKRFWMAGLLQPNREFKPEDLLNFVKNQKLDFTPGSKGAYSNTNSILLGLVAEKITGQKVSELIRERVVRPLDLKGTFLDTEGTVIPELAQGYIDFASASALFSLPSWLIYFVPKKLLLGDRLLKSTYFVHPSSTWAAGSVISTPTDMATIVKALFEKRLVSQKALDEMMKFEPCLIMNQNIDYGLGLMAIPTSSGPSYGHGGLYFGYKTQTLFVPERELTISQMHNFLPSGAENITDLLIHSAFTTHDYQACRIPKAFFENIPESGSNLSFRFKGQLTAEGFPEVPGLSYFPTYLEGKREPHYGLHAQAILKSDQQGSFVEISSVGPGKGANVSVRLASLILSSSLFEKATQKNPLIVTEKDRALVALSEVELYKDSQKPKKVCFTSVRDDLRPFEIAFCDAAKPFAAGNNIRVFGKLGLLTNKSKVKKYLEAHGLPECYCFDEQGAKVTCQ